MTDASEAQAKASWKRFLSLRFWVYAILSLGLAVVAFANAASQVGATLSIFRPLGPAFYNDTADLLRLEVEIATRPEAARQARIGELAVSMLASAPLNPRALRDFGLHREALGDIETARVAFQASNRISRRDGVTQYWLFQDAAKRGDVDTALSHLDRILRVKPDTSQPLIDQLGILTANAEARGAMVRFIDAENPWLVRYVDAAIANLPNVGPLAQLFVEAGRAPDLPALRTPYRQVVAGLIDDRQIALLRRFYPLLPDARASDFHGIAVNEKAVRQSYPPIAWDLGQSSDQGGALIQHEGSVALELFSIPDTRGIAARKFFIAPSGASRIEWVVADRSRNEGSSAYWVLRCLHDNGPTSEFRSENLMGVDAGSSGEMPLPQGCDAILAHFEMAGGTGRNPARVVLGSIAIS